MEEYKESNIGRDLSKVAGIVLCSWAFVFGTYFYANAAIEKEIYNPIRTVRYYIDLAKDMDKRNTRGINIEKKTGCELQ